eukprot:GGOE01042887.1.p1 GENE.GGOE01042887.1~~GGOE01042887.1.p1  ORF type:complete len:835 (-),score=240.87 GGOE01042887.1:277-2781(-)
MDAAVPQSEWQQEYAEFLTTSWEERQHRKQRIAAAVSFLQRNLDAPLVKRVEFLLYKSLSQAEIEEAFEIAGQVPELLRLMEGKFTQQDLGPSAEELALALAEELKTPFRPGDRVFAYIAPLGAYHLAVIECIDERRGHDILRIRYTEVPHPDVGWVEWRAVGYKEVVADAVPARGALRRGLAVISPLLTQPGLQDAVVLEVNEYVSCNLEFSSAQRLSAVPTAQVRTVLHPKEVAELPLEVAQDAAGPKSTVLSAAERFPLEGHRERQVQARELAALMGTESLTESNAATAAEDDDMTLEERYTLGVSIQHFMRYPYLDVDHCCAHLRTYSEVVGSLSDGRVPQFDLSQFKRHPDCSHLFEYNPILEVARQCRLLDTMFVDPDFPPTPATLAPTGESSSSLHEAFEWRRLTEVFPRPCCFVGELQLTPPKRGPFTAKWMAPVFVDVSRGFEFETLFSPYQAPSYFGCYTVRLHVDGRFWYVLLDNFVPVHAGNESLACLRSSNHGEIWPSLLEKVYAKLVGSYSALLSSEAFGPEAAFEDLSCGVSFRNEYALVSNPGTWLENLLGCFENKAYCTLLLAAPTTTKVSSERKLHRLGIELGGYHVVQHVVGVPEDELTQFVLSADPCGLTEVEERAQQLVLQTCGPRQLGSLQEVALKHQQRTGIGGIWLPLLEHLRLFESCITLYGLWGWKRVIMQGTFDGHCGVNRFVYDNERWPENPQISVRIFTPTPFFAQVALRDVRFRRDRPQGEVLRITLVRASQTSTPARVEEPLVVTSDSLQLDASTVRHPYTVRLSMVLGKGNYVVIPEIGPEGCREAFVLKMWSPDDFLAQPL